MSPLSRIMLVALVLGAAQSASAAVCGTNCSLGLDDDCDTIGDIDEALLGTSSIDCDTDHDGIRDDVEVYNVLVPRDTDGDGIIDARDPDSDGDSISDAFEGKCSGVCTTPADSDRDGIPDYRDSDSDGDTIADKDEAGDAVLATAPVDTDGDRTPDVLDLESDGDGMLDAAEAGDANVATPPVDTDGDGIPNFQDANDRDGPNGDFDGDGVSNGTDNCPTIPNPTQLDTGGLGVGDACLPTNPTDSDGDGIPDAIDNCVTVANLTQLDTDDDGFGDACDILDTSDTDEDGVDDAHDNCPSTPNPSQTDDDLDGVGDACDPQNDGSHVDGGDDGGGPEPRDLPPGDEDVLDDDVVTTQNDGQPDIALGSGAVSCASVDGSGFTVFALAFGLIWRGRRRWTRGLAVLATVGASLSATAYAADGFDARSSRPTLYGQGAAVLPRAANDGQLNLTVGVVNDFAHAPLRFSVDGRNEIAIRSQNTTDLQLRVDLPFRLTVAADIPFVSSRAFGQWDLGQNKLADAQIGARVTPYQGSRGALAVYLGARLPTGSTDYMTGAGVVEPEAGVIGELHLGRVTASGLLGYRDVKSTFAARVLPDQLVYSAGASVRIVDPLSAFVYLTGGLATNRSESPLEAQTGARVVFGHVSAFAALGLGISNGAGVPDVRGIAGLAFAIRKEQPALRAPEPTLAPPPESHVSAPVASIAPQVPVVPAVADRDNDGVPDAKDACPGVRETPNGFKDGDGCPDERPEITFESGKPVVLSDLVFLGKSADLDPISDDALVRITRSLLIQQDTRLCITARVEQSSNAKADNALALAQARVVMERLMELGVPQDRLTFSGVIGGSQRIELVSE